MTYVKSGKRAFTNRFLTLIDYSKYIKGATYLPLAGSIVILTENSNLDINFLLDDNDRNPRRTISSQYWPIHLYPCQNMTSYFSTM